MSVKTKRKLLFGKTLLIAFAATIVVVVLLVYITGLSTHRSILHNAWISATILAIGFFLFLSRGLYIGLNVVDDYSHKLQIYWKKRRKSNAILDANPHLGDFPDAGDSIIGAIIMWIFMTLALIMLLALFEVVIWAALLLMLLAIYWIFIRALKLVFSKSSECEGDLVKSCTYAFGYTLFYVGWLFLVIFISTKL